MTSPLARYFQDSTAPAALTPLSVADTGSDLLGRTIAGIGDAIDQIAQKDESFWVQKQMMEIDDFSRKAWEQSINSSQDGAGGFATGYLNQLDQRYDQSRQLAPSGRARRMLDMEMLGHRTAQAAAADGFATQEKFEFRKYTIEQDVDNFAQEIWRNPGVAPWQPNGSLITAPGLPSSFEPATGFFSTGMKHPHTGEELGDNLAEWSSAYYSPRDFADGVDMRDRSGGVMISKDVVSRLDWVTDQFGMGKLQINSGYRSPESNLARAESGSEGPHTHGQAMDVQVRNLPQSEKNRLYSLFKAAGFNAFGFGEGVLHVEKRDGKAPGKGRGGDYEWTYGNTAAYQLVPVVAPNSRAQMASEVPASASGDMTGIRPFQSWERRTNSDGTHSTELTTTFQDANGQWVNAPSLWRNADGWVELDEDQQLQAVADYEANGGQAFPRFNTLAEAEEAARSRSAAGGAGAAGDAAYNQYPHLSALSMTAMNETGTTDLATASLQIAREADGTVSVGALGLNSSGLLPAFIGANPDLGITAAPGTPEFAQQWNDAVRRDPEGVVGRQIAFHEAKIVRPAQSALQAMGAGSVANDPRAIAFTADMIVQYGAAIAKKHLAAGRGASDVSAFVSAVTASTKASIDQDFRTALAKDPSVKQGLLNRIDKRAASAMTASPGHAISTGNVPAWGGPVPSIEDMPEFAGRFARIDAMVDTIGGTPAQRRQVKDNLRGQVVKAWVSRVADVNPSAAMAVLMSGKYDKELSIGDTMALTGGAQSAYRAMESEIRQKQKDLVDSLKLETSQLLADEIASVSTTGKSLGRLSPANMAIMSDKDKSDLAFAGFTYETSKQISSARSEDLAAILQDLEPEGDGFAEELRRYQFAQEQVKRRLEMQKTDPAALALQQSPDIMAQWNEAFTSNDPGKVSTAIAVVRAAQERLGVKPEDIRSMPQATMATFEQLLTKAEDADQAFANLVQIQQMFGNETDTVMAEMERAGMGKGWREAAGLIDAGHMLPSKALARVVQAGEYGDDSALGVRLAMDGRPEIARKIFDGRLRRKEIPGLMPTGKDDDLDMNVKQIIGDHMGNALEADGAMFNAVREAALSAYAADIPFGASVDGEKITAALDAVTGGVLEFNGDGERGKFIAPVAGMTQQEFNTGIWDLDNQALENAYIGYASEDEPLSRDQLPWVQFISAGNGVYFIEWPGNGLARDSEGQPFVLDYAKAVEESRARAKAQREEAAKNVVLPFAAPGQATTDNQTGIPRSSFPTHRN